MADTEPIIIVCMRSNVPGRIYIDGAETGECAKCAEDISVAPSTKSLLGEMPGAELWCFECVAEFGEAMPIMPPTLEQLDEIGSELARGKH